MSITARACVLLLPILRRTKYVPFISKLALLTPFKENTATRNSNYYEIIEGVNLGKKQQDIINSFQHLIWFGDLNYRFVLSCMGVRCA